MGLGHSRAWVGLIGTFRVPELVGQGPRGKEKTGRQVAS